MVHMNPLSSNGANAGSQPNNEGIVLVGGTVIAPEGTIRDGWVHVFDGVIRAIGKNEPPDALQHDVRELGGAWIAPGFVDLHCHGGGGGSFLNGEHDQARTAVQFHRRNGTTTILASLISSPHEHLLRAARSLARYIDSDDTMVGLHIEGPYLSHVHCGAHDPRHLRPPSIGETRELIAAGQGTIRQMTIAPELPGALDVIDMLAEAGIVSAIGHTNATSEQTKTAIARGARLATHLCNAMPSIHHRNGGPVVEIINDKSVFVELINDGVHIDPSVVRLLIKSIGIDRICMITDAISAAGQQNGRYRLDGRDIDVIDGTVRLATPEAPLAGSALTMRAAFANSVSITGSVVAAARMCATTPAHLLQIRDRGALVRNRRADMVVLNESFDVLEVWQAGERVVASE